MRGTPGSPPQDLRSLFLFRFSLSSPFSSLPPLFLFQQLIHRPPPPARAWPLMGVCPPAYPASPSLTNTYPLGNASTLVPSGFSVNTSLLVVCAKYLPTSTSLGILKPLAYSGQRSREISDVQERGAKEHASTHTTDCCHVCQPRVLHLCINGAWSCRV